MITFILSFVLFSGSQGTNWTNVILTRLGDRSCLLEELLALIKNLTT